MQPLLVASVRNRWMVRAHEAEATREKNQGRRKRTILERVR